MNPSEVLKIVTDLRPVRILLIENDPETISAVAILSFEIKNCSLALVSNPQEMEIYFAESDKPDLILFSDLTLPDPLEIYDELLAVYPEAYTIVIAPEIDLELGKKYREKGACEGIYKLENYLGNLRHALRKGLVHVWKAGANAIPGFLRVFESGQSLLHYSILELAGAGLLADVYKAEDTRENRIVAIKVLPPGIANQVVVKRRLIREATAASNMQHRGIANVYAIEEADGLTLLVMEYLEGESLRDALRKGSLGMYRLLDIGAQVSEALAVCHQSGIIHGDLKPGNIMISPNGQVSILDFGLPRRFPQKVNFKGNRGLIELAAHEIAWDSLPYLSPEQIKGEDLDGRSDLFSLGCILYQAGTGELPFDGANPESIINSILNKNPESPGYHKSHLQGEFDEIVMRALTKERTKRLATASELGSVLSELKSKTLPQREEEIIETKTAGEVVVGPPTTKKKYAGLIVSVVVALLIVVAGLIVYKPGARERTSLIVFPFRQHGAGAPDLSIAGGISVLLMNSLSRSSGLQVIQPATAFQFEKVDHLLDSAEALKVKKALTGSVSKKDGQESLEIQLMEIPGGKPLWKQEYSLQLQSIYTTNHEIVSEVLNQLNAPLTAEQETFLSKQPAVSANVIENYLLGLYFYQKHTMDDLHRCISHNDLALAENSDFAPAQAARALAYLDLAEITSNTDYYQKAADAATRALLLQEKLPDAHVVLGAVNLLFKWDVKTAEMELNRAITLDGSSSRAFSYLAVLRVALQQTETAVQAMNQAEYCDPRSGIVRTEQIRLLVKLRMYREALAKAYSSMDLMNPVVANMLVGDAHLGEKSIDDALIAYKRCKDLGSPDAETRIASVLATSGMKRQAELLLEKIVKSPGLLNPDLVAAAYARLGNSDQAMMWLEKSYQKRSRSLVLLNVDPDFDSIKQDPRFIKFIARISINQVSN